MTMTGAKAMMALAVIVEEEVEFLFGDMIATGQGIGTSDITACMNNIVHAVNGQFDLHLDIARDMVYTEIERLEKWHGIAQSSDTDPHPWPVGRVKEQVDSISVMGCPREDLWGLIVVPLRIHPCRC